ncbi:LOW QUALITY PROTEIN: protein FAM184B [Rhea pennata]|uniref:LOW QUALITY PROTEIN: protein FAM184B n=1 Tax=Rhea pennata TaxID=8795 RepID=UPI002E271ECE
MASGISKVHQPGTCNGSSGARGSSAGECNQEIQVQMCKKIAQLTKVIYALNTKNDEHEASIQALKDAHEEEIQHILAETRKTVLQYKSKVEEEQLLRKHIQVLEDAVEQHKRLKEEALAELTLFKKEVEERELRIEVKQSQMNLSTDTVDTNADFENKLPPLNLEHEGLLDECKASRRENLDTKEILDEKCSVEEQALINEVDSLKSENQRVSGECTQKNSQLQASYEREKETFKKTMQQSMAERQRELEQTKCLEAQEGFLLQQVKKLEVDLEERTWKINEWKKHSQKVKERIQELQIQLEELKKNKSKSEIKQPENGKEALTTKRQNSSLEVAQLKQILDQQANNFKESLKKHELQSNKEKEKLLQDLHNTIKENQNVKLQLESSHQKILKILEKSKNQELKEAEEHLKKEFNETFKIQHQSHKLEMQTLEEKAKKELQDELEQIQKEQTLLLGSLRMELSEQQTSCASLKKQIEDLQAELRSVRTLKKQQEGSSQSQIRSLHEELEKSQHEVSGLKKENLLLKHAMELLSAELESQKQEAAQLQDREKQHRRLKGLKDKPRRQESRQEDIHLISCLQDKISEREKIIKQLVEGRKFQHSLSANTESYRNRSFSFNPNLGCLTPSMKQKKMDEVPSRVVSVPNLASYAKSFFNCDLRSKRSVPQIPKSTSLDQSPGCFRMGYLAAQSISSATARTHNNEALQTKDDQKRIPQHQEWFTKYFSF